MRSPTTTGDECPGGRAAFQRTLVVGPMSAGSGTSCAGRPEPWGPRNCGQSEARTSWEVLTIRARARHVARANFVMEVLIATTVPVVAFDRATSETLVATGSSGFTR